MTDHDDPAVVAAREITQWLSPDAFGDKVLNAIRTAYAKREAELAATKEEIKRLEAGFQYLQEARVKQTAELAAAKDEIERLRKFVEYFLNERAWDNFAFGESDGGTVQEKAEEFGLIELRPCDPEDSIDGETEHYFCVWTPKKESK